MRCLRLVGCEVRDGARPSDESRPLAPGAEIDDCPDEAAKRRTRSRAGRARARCYDRVVGLRYVLAALLLAGACEGPAPLPAGDITAVTFNVHGRTAIRDPVMGPNMAGQIDSYAPDFVSAQECVGCDDLLALLDPRYDRVPTDRAVNVIFDSDRWELAAYGAIDLGGNDDGWGVRSATWGEFVQRGTSEKVVVYSTHFCVTIRTTDDPCDADRQIGYVERIRADFEGHAAAALIVGGDLNVFDGFADGPVVEHIEALGWLDVAATAGATDDTFQGNSWAPAGRIDYVFASPAPEVREAFVDQALTDEAGTGSDHYPVVTTFAFSP
jgi:hypothetical protein